MISYPRLLTIGAIAVGLAAAIPDACHVGLLLLRQRIRRVLDAVAARRRRGRKVFCAARPSQQTQTAASAASRGRTMARRVRSNRIIGAALHCVLWGAAARPPAKAEKGRGRKNRVCPPLTARSLYACGWCVREGRPYDRRTRAANAQEERAASSFFCGRDAPSDTLKNSSRPRTSACDAGD